MRTLPSWILYRPLLGASAEHAATRIPALVITGIYMLVSLIYGILSEWMKRSLVQLSLFH